MQREKGIRQVNESQREGYQLRIYNYARTRKWPEQSLFLFYLRQKVIAWTGVIASIYIERRQAIRFAQEPPRTSRCRARSRPMIHVIKVKFVTSLSLRGDNIPRAIRGQVSLGADRAHRYKRIFVAHFCASRDADRGLSKFD